MLQRFCLISWRLFHGLMWYLEYWFCEHNKCRSPWPIFYGPVILPSILNVIWCMNIIIWDYELVCSNSWPKSKCRSLWPIFHGPVILCYILKTIWCMNPNFDPKVNIIQHDLYFKVKWFCLISSRLFNGLTWWYNGSLRPSDWPLKYM